MIIYTREQLQDQIDNPGNEQIEIIDCGVSIYTLASDNSEEALQKIAETLAQASVLETRYRAVDEKRHTKAAPHRSIAILVRGDLEYPELAEALPGYEKSLNNLFMALEKLKEELNKYSLWLILENPAGKILISPIELRELIDELNSPWLGVYFNPAHVAPTLSKDDFGSILGKRVFATAKNI